MHMKVLVVDVGGTHVKVMATGLPEERKVDSGPTMRPDEMVVAVKALTADWEYEVVSLGYPGPVVHDAPFKEPVNLGPGWVGFDYAAAFGRPVKIVNDAAMQALGSYDGGRMLFLGLGTGLGSTLIWETNVLPLELGDLPYGNGDTIEDYLGKSGMKELGEKEWKREVLRAVLLLKKSLIADYVVLGGGSAKKFDRLPDGIELGHNRNAFLGGVRLWQTDPRTRRAKWRIM
jgi:polyphosphate glucokinase